MVRVVRFHETGGPDVLRYEDVPVRSPAADEVRIRVDAIGLNRAEVDFRRGTYVERPVLPAGLGTEAAGEVVEVGSAVDRWQPGDAICVLPAFSPNDYSVYAEETVVPAAALVARPDGVDAITGAALWMPYLTVYGMVQEVVRVRPGDSVVVTAATNSIGMAAMQVLRHLGAVPIATASSAAHTGALEAAGAAAVLVEGADVVGQIRSLTGGRGADVVLDANGGPQVEQLVRSCAAGAAVIVHGGLSRQPTPLPAGGSVPVWLRRYRVRETIGDAGALHRAQHFIRAGLAAGALAPLVDRVFDFDDIRAAHAYVDSSERGPGKPVVRVGRAPSPEQ
ncbi:zinc-dependent alcohol dehydrogenase family protein [Geodermatophilus sp. CPCC 206100]|uniref:zinc-dependent alcohol dehydrogenase family protein n=1 Tax=Geodermatophilus sp. CPCC 206100 TaxID=3020054 RepID=UPI003B00A7D5